jgi:hypothetical protein
MKTSELTGKALNWAVGKAEGLDDWLAPVNYCGKWEHGGPIIERECICIHQRMGETAWWADYANPQVKPDGTGHRFLFKQAPTPLIAAMRCYVASKLGDEVNVPKELP